MTLVVYKVQKLPIEVEAVWFNVENIFHQEEIAKWCGGSLLNKDLLARDRSISIWTLEGEMKARFGDWIIKGVKGEFYPCKPNIFHETYIINRGKINDD